MPIPPTNPGLESPLQLGLAGQEQAGKQVCECDRAESRSHSCGNVARRRWQVGAGGLAGLGADAE